jgi:hypothetical protein
MKRLNAIAVILAAFGFVGFSVSSAGADIYSWIDENGVKNFTNQAPPKQATLFMKTPEIPHDEEADLRRREMDQLEVTRFELAEREAFLRKQAQEAERRLAEANARADAALQEADRIVQEAQDVAENTDYNSGTFVYGYGGSRYLYKDYYRNYGLYYKKKPHHTYKKNFSGYRSRPSYYSRHHLKLGPSPRVRHFRSGGLTHRQRTAAFRGRFGRY